jgi:hypothetical protein
MLHKLHVCLHSSEPWDNAHRPNPITDSLTGASGWFGRTALHVYEQEHGPEALRRELIPLRLARALGGVRQSPWPGEGLRVR